MNWVWIRDILIEFTACFFSGNAKSSSLNFFAKNESVKTILIVLLTITWFFLCNLEWISTSKFFKDHKVHSPYGLVHFCWSLKNLLVLIYSKLHSKSCDYLYIEHPVCSLLSLHPSSVMYSVTPAGSSSKCKPLLNFLGFHLYKVTF